MSTNVKLTAVSSFGKVAAGRDGQLAVLVEVSCGALQTRERRQPINLGLVVDRSGSMSGAPLHYAKAACVYAVKNLNGDDRLAIVAFDSDVTTVAHNAPVTDKASLLAAIAEIECGSATDLCAGLLKGCEEVADWATADFTNRVILLSDGQANQGITDPKKIARRVQGYKAKGISITSIGLGSHFTEDLLAEVAQSTGGSFHYIKTPEQIPGVFEEELKGMMAKLGQGVKLGVRNLANGVSVRSVWGYEPYALPGGMQMDLPDLSALEESCFGFEFAHTALAAGEVKLGTFFLKYDDVSEGGGPVELTMDLSLSVAAREEEVAESVDRNAEAKLDQISNALVLEKAIAAADSGDVDGAGALLDDRMLRLQAKAVQCASPEFAEAQGRHNEELRNLSDVRMSVQRRYDNVTRKDMRSMQNARTHVPRRVADPNDKS